MTIEKKLNGSQLSIALGGRLDTTTAPQLEAEIKRGMEEIDSLVLDFSELEYISSAGLRVLLIAHKVMSRQEGMVIRGSNETILEVFEVTGFTDFLTLE